MLKKLKRKSKRVLSYIGDDYYKCLYLFLDYEKYGVSNPNVDFWIQEKNNTIVSLILKYYDGMHIYSKDDNADVMELVYLIKKEKPLSIFSSCNLIKSIGDFIKNYNMSVGTIRELSNINCDYDFDDVVKDLSMTDYEKLSSLILNDSIGFEYTKDKLIGQFIERRKEKYGRNYIIKDKDRVIAHAGTGAENSKVAIMNFVITDSSYRSKGYGFKIICNLCSDLLEEGKKVYLINYTDISTALYSKVGFKEVYKIGRLTKE